MSFVECGLVALSFGVGPRLTALLVQTSGWNLGPHPTQLVRCLVPLGVIARGALSDESSIDIQVTTCAVRLLHVMNERVHRIWSAPLWLLRRTGTPAFPHTASQGSSASLKSIFLDCNFSQ